VQIRKLAGELGGTGRKYHIKATRYLLANPKTGYYVGSLVSAKGYLEEFSPIVAFLALKTSL
jgi:hypothetical protein